MSSGSLKDLIKAISKYNQEFSLPLPVPLLEIISSYLERHSADDELDSQILQDELLTVYQAIAVENSACLIAFLAVLQRLKIVLRDSGRLFQWWNQILTPIIQNFSAEPLLAVETKKILLELLLYDDDNAEGRQVENAKATSCAITEILLASWLEMTKKADEELNDHASTVSDQIQTILIEFGKKKPRNLLSVLNSTFVQQETRVLSLSLLCSFFRDPPPRLHEMLSTPLFMNLLRCLQSDSSVRVVSLAMTALIMFLPHIPSITSKHLPALFNIYTRLLFWDRVKRAEESSSPVENEGERDDTAEFDWPKLHNFLDVDDESVPEILHFFTFLYGLYPINFMSYIRKPRKYLRQAKFPGVDELDIQPIELIQRSEPFRQVHLLHPNFLTFTIDSELNDNNRWVKSDAADVVAECMALHVPSDDMHEPPHNPNWRAIEPNEFVTDHLNIQESFSMSHQAPYPVKIKSSCKSAGLPDRPYSSIDSPIDFPIRNSNLSDKNSLSSSSFKKETKIIKDTHISLSARYLNKNDTLAPTKHVNSEEQRSMIDDSVASLTLTNHSEPVKNYVSCSGYSNSFQCFPHHEVPSHSAYCNSRLAYLCREIQLLKNNLNFERYLKQQHISHIGRLRRKQIREARIEAETQNVITSNRTLKLKLEEVKRQNTQLKKECEKSKSHCRKWEAQLSAKLRLLREEQRKWIVERENLTRDINTATNDIATMKHIIVQAEANELKALQKATHAESNLEELEHLRREVRDLVLRVRIFEVKEEVAKTSKSEESSADSRIFMLEAELTARDQELIEAKKTFEKELSLMRERVSEQYNTSLKSKKDCVQNANKNSAAASRTRMTELQKSYDHLLTRYLKLQDENYSLRSKLPKNISRDTEKITNYEKSSQSCSLSTHLKNSESNNSLHNSSGSYPDDDNISSQPTPELLDSGK
ncbi:BgTH12-04677 [Blumeria graminis f. sp. triticale]|nr:BgTH12-04677 [Blumeria graminis f. sp. triticale]